MPLAEMQAGPALRRGAARALAIVCWLSACELLVRTVLRSASLPDVSTALLDVAAHTGRVAVLVPALVLLDLVVTLVAATGPGATLGRVTARLFARLTSPARLARIGLVTGVGYVVLVRTIGLHYQIAWEAGATYAPLVAAAAAVADLVVAELVRRQPDEPARLAGFAALLVVVTLFAALVISATVDLPGRTPRLGTMALTLVIFAIVRAATPDPRTSALHVALAGLVALGLIATDVLDRGLRRFDSVTTPFSVLGSTLLAAVTDLDGDGVPLGVDCDDTDPRVSPLAPDLPDDGVDQNCMGGDGDLAKSLQRYGPEGVHAQVRSAKPVRAPVFFITVDAWRADSFDDATFPETRALTRSCQRFTNARATASYTGPSMISLHMGVFPTHIYADDGSVAIREADLPAGETSRPPTLAASLTLRGPYWTSVVFPVFNGGNLLFLTGHAVVRIVPPRPPSFFPDAPTTFEQVAAARAEARPDMPLFLRVHLMDLHAPYRGRSGRDGYFETARDLDHDLAAFLRSLPKDAIVVLTGDHGEAFGEHGYEQHGHTLFDEELRVPLVLCVPEQSGLGPPREVDTAVSLVDITPTILDLVGIDAPYPRHGESLVPLVRDGTRRRAWVYAENVNLGQRAVVLGCDKLIVDAKAGYTVLFDVCADPRERRDLSRARPEARTRMERLLAEIVDLDLDAFRSSRLGTKPVE